MLERELEAKFKKRVEQHGGLVWKFVSPGKAGVPDRIVMLGRGICVFAEIKKPGLKQRALQLFRQRELGRYGCKVWLIDSEKAIDDFIDEYYGH